VLAGSCMLIDRQHDISPKKKDAYLIVPTFKVTGIEDPNAIKVPSLEKSPLLVLEELDDTKRHMGTSH
jgi:hypothetical protein